MSFRRTAGFTLIEMLVSLAIFASLMGALMFAYSQGLSMWERGKTKTSYWQSMEHRYALISALFMQAQVAQYHRVDSMYVSYFDGNSNRIRFLSRAPLFDLPGRVRPVELTIQRVAGDHYALVYKEAARYQDPARGIAWDDANEVVLFDGLASGSFSFEAPIFELPDELNPQLLRGNARNRYRSAPEWVSEFNAEWMWRVPQRVGLSFSDKDGNATRWTFGLATESDAWTLEVYSVD